MRFFEAFPKTLYSFDNKDPVILTHILRRFKFNQTLKGLISEHDLYVVGDNETPEMVSSSVYGTPNYHWVILLFNNILDPFTDWVVDQETLINRVAKTYQFPDAIHHYEKGDRVVPSTAEGAVAVSNYEYEYALNEARRKIRIPKKHHLGAIVAELDKILQENR